MQLLKITMAWNIYWIALLLFSVLLAQQVSSQELSCKGRCAEAFKRGRQCDCDTDCARFGKCCPDYKEACLVVQTTSAPPKTTATTPSTTTTTTTPLLRTTTKPPTTTPKPKSTTKRSPKTKPKPKPAKKKKKQKKVSHEVMEEHSKQSSSSSSSSTIRRTKASSRNSGDKRKKKNGKNDEEIEETEKAKKSSKSSSKAVKSKAVRVISEEDGSGVDNVVTTVATTTTTTSTTSQPSSTTRQPSTTTTTKQASTTVTTKQPSTTTTVKQPSTTTRQSSTMTTIKQTPTTTKAVATPSMTIMQLPSTAVTTTSASTTTTTRLPSTTTTTGEPSTSSTTRLPSTTTTTEKASTTSTTREPSTTANQPDTERTTKGNKDKPTTENPTNKNTNTTVTQVTTTSLVTSKPLSTPTSTVDKTTQYTSTLPATLTTKRRVIYYPTTIYSTTRSPERTPNITREYVRPEKIVTPLLYKDVPEEMNLCNKKPADGIVPLQNGSLAVFRGHYYWLLNGTSSPSPCPRKITEVWGIPSPIDTVFSRCNCDGKTFFLKDSQYWRFTNDRMDTGYPKPIIKGFGGLNGKIVAALSVAKHRNRPESVYFFKKGGNVQQYTYKQEGTKKCKQKAVTVKYPAYKPRITMKRQQRRRRRFERALRPHQIFRTMKVHHYPMVQVSHYPTGTLQQEGRITSIWRGFPKEVNSVISVPNYQKPDGYDYYAFSKDQYYNLDVGSRIARPVTSQTGQTVSKAWYKCPSE